MSITDLEVSILKMESGLDDFQNFVFLYYCMYVMCGCACVVMLMRRSEDNFVESIFSFHLYVNSENQAQIFRLVPRLFTLWVISRAWQ